MLVSETE
jgi:two-component system, chemotaxis family, protein-glutamate methylesterase/glutaminase